MCDYCFITAKKNIIGKSIYTDDFKKTAGYREPKKYKDYLDLFILKNENDKKAGLMIDNGNGYRFIDIDYCPFCGRKLNEKLEGKDEIN